MVAQCTWGVCSELTELPSAEQHQQHYSQHVPDHLPAYLYTATNTETHLGRLHPWTRSLGHYPQRVATGEDRQVNQALPLGSAPSSTAQTEAHRRVDLPERDPQILEPFDLELFTIPDLELPRPRASFLLINCSSHQGSPHTEVLGYLVSVWASISSCSLSGHDLLNLF